MADFPKLLMQRNKPWAGGRFAAVPLQQVEHGRSVATIIQEWGLYTDFLLGFFSQSGPAVLHFQVTKGILRRVEQHPEEQHLSDN